mmetsp:Transcript_65270/g.202111  ORF Transcript_65270/g.202111 Transcript_65270/m.202111 type:complete len:82 (+) Transcript_65270:369-614(+)
MLELNCHITSPLPASSARTVLPSIGSVKLGILTSTRPPTNATAKLTFKPVLHVHQLVLRRHSNQKHHTVNNMKTVIQNTSN